jgi:hypothetical protein
MAKPGVVISEIWLQYAFKDPFSAFSLGLFFPENFVVLSDEHDENFHREV